MKKLLANDHLILAARILLGSVFVVASIEKAANPGSFTVSIENYRMVPYEVATVAATLIPWIELLCGLALLCGLFTRGGALLSFVMLVVFTAAVVSALQRGLDISCGCFTQDPNVGKVGWTKVGENVLLILASLFVFLSTGLKFSLAQYFHRQAQPAQNIPGGK